MPHVRQYKSDAPYVPTEEEIYAEAAKLREGWDEARLRAAAGTMNPQPVEIEPARITLDSGEWLKY